MDEEHILVDEVAAPQRLDQLSAAQDPEISSIRSWRINV